MPRSSSAALDWAIAEQWAVWLPECQRPRDLALHEAGCALLERDLAMRVHCFVVVAGAQLDLMIADASSSLRWEAIAASQARELVVRLLGEVDFGKHRSYEVSDRVEIDDERVYMRVDYVEEETEKGRS